MVRVARVLVAVVSALALVSAVMGGCVGKGGSTGPKDVIYLGFVGPLTGPCAASGDQMLKGAKLAVKMLNEAGGVNGRRVELVVADDRADPKEAASIANMFVSDNRIVAVAGHYNSSNVLASAPICAEGKLAMTHVGVSPNISRQTAPTMFRISVTAAAQAKDIAKWIFAEENLKSLAILYENTDYGRGEGGALEREFQALGGNVCYKGLYQLGETKDFTGILTAMKGTNPQAAFISGGYTEAALIVKQAKGLGVNVPFFGSDGFYEEEFIRLAGDAAEGVRITGLYVPDDPDPDVQRFVSAFKAEYGTMPGVWAGAQFDAVMLLAEAIKAVGPVREKIVQYLYDMPKPFKGVTGEFKFDANNDSTRHSMKRLIVRGGKFTLYTR